MPKGNPDGGQWTDEDHSGATSTSPKPSWYQRNKNWVKPVAIGVGVAGAAGAAILTGGAAVPEEIEGATLLEGGTEGGNALLGGETTGANTGEAVATGTSTEAEISNTIAQANQISGNEGTLVSSRSVAEDAAKQFVGEDARPIYDRAGNQVGQISADGTKVARYTSVDKPDPYINLENKTNGGNLHIRWNP